MSQKVILQKSWSILLMFVIGVSSHGYMSVPPSRSYLWKVKQFAPLDPHVNYDYMGANCGGLAMQTSNGGKCGICGDNYNGPRRHEPGPDGTFAQGIISACFTGAQNLDVTVHLTSNHKGWMEWRLCPQDDVTSNVTQSCLDQHLLKITSKDGDNWFKDGDSRLMISSVGIKADDYFRVSLAIPPGVECEACVLQWIYKAGNNWGCETVDGTQICDIGLGEEQEEFRNCADIAILDSCPVNVLDLTHNEDGDHHVHNNQDQPDDDNPDITHFSDLQNDSDHSLKQVHHHDHSSNSVTPTSDRTAGTNQIPKPSFTTVTASNPPQKNKDKTNLLAAFHKQIKSLIQDNDENGNILFNRNRANPPETVVPDIDAAVHNSLLLQSDRRPVLQDLRGSRIFGSTLPTHNPHPVVNENPLHSSNFAQEAALGSEDSRTSEESSDIQDNFEESPISFLGFSSLGSPQPTGTCVLGLDVVTDSMLKTFCSDRNCQVDYKLRQCRCF